MATVEKTASQQNKVAKNGAATPKVSAKQIENNELEQLKKQLKQAEETAAKAGKEAQEAKKQAEQMQEELEVRKPMNVVDAMVRVYEAKGILERLEYLRETKKSLSAFSIGRSELKDELKLSDGSGHVFQTTNSNTIGTVLETLKDELDGKISTTEKELLTMV